MKRIKVINKEIVTSKMAIGKCESILIKFYEDFILGDIDEVVYNRENDITYEVMNKLVEFITVSQDGELEVGLKYMNVSEKLIE